MTSHKTAAVETILVFEGLIFDETKTQPVKPYKNETTNNNIIITITMTMTMTMTMTITMTMTMTMTVKVTVTVTMTMTVTVTVTMTMIIIIIVLLSDLHSAKIIKYSKALYKVRLRLQ